MLHDAIQGSSGLIGNIVVVLSNDRPTRHAGAGCWQGNRLPLYAAHPGLGVTLIAWYTCLRWARTDLLLVCSSATHRTKPPVRVWLRNFCAFRTRSAS